MPRETTSLCPTCTREARQAVVDGKATPDLFIKQHAGEIPAQIIERDGKIWMVKDCPKHGHFEDVLSTDPAFFKRTEELFMGADIPVHAADGLHEHGLSALQYGRGAVLTVDLTNRCNMMCDPCFTDANQVGFVHELEWDEIKAILDRAAAKKPQRQMSVQFSGGEPTISTHFLKAVAYCKELGFRSVQAATNGIEFAKDPEFCRKAREAGLRFVYLQFDGIGNAANQHRHVPNLFDVKLRAIENLHAAGVDIVPVSDDHQRRQQRAGRAHRRVRPRQPEEDLVPLVPARVVHGPRRGDLGRAARRAALHAGGPRARHQAADRHRRAAPRLVPDLDDDDVRRLGRPAARDEPTSGASSTAGATPTAASGMAVMIDKETKERAAVSAFLDGWQLVKDLAVINDAARGKRFLSQFGMAVSLLRNYNSFKTPTRFRLTDLLKKFDKAFGATGRDYGHVGKGRTLADVQKRRGRTAGCSCSSPACGSRTSGPTTSGARTSAASPTARRKARSRSAPTTPASAGGRSSRSGTRPPRWRSGTTRRAATRSTPAGTSFRWRRPTIRWSLNADALAAGRAARPRPGGRGQDRARREAAAA